MKRIFMLSGLCALLCHFGCKPKTEEKEKEGQYFVTSPVYMDTAVTREYVSQIRSVRNIEIRAQERGYLETSYVDEGQVVKKGQLLFKIMPKIYESELQKATAEAKAAEIELKNTQALADKHIVSPNELALANTRLQKAKAEQALASVHLAFTEIRAPFDGIVDRLPRKIGSLIEEGDLLTTLSDNSQMYAYFNVAEPEYLDYAGSAAKNNKATVQLIQANNQVFKYPGVVETIESEFNNETGNIAFRATFPNPDRILRHGETGKVQMKVQLKNAMVIPQKATYEIQDKRYVYIVGKDNTLKSKEISIAAEMPDLFVVGSGIGAGDKILLEGVQKVKDEQKISYQYQAPEKVIAQLRLKAE
ncbi:efflux RND transporter periplasmic adaptor subunit [Chitinophaga terrae (ex Kim and Jung 2007)]|nr:efflux RND transporter periplasmic adaptor subunit [Chitinophaga terrae (ex Kim and Jung 2007)]